jgi:hypothetical protein
MARYSPPPDSNDSDCIPITIKIKNNKNPSIISQNLTIILPFNNN